MYFICVLLGLTIAALEIVAARNNRVTRVSGTASRIWVSIHQGRWVWGLSPALLSLFVIYPLPSFGDDAEKFRVAGFPFMVGMFGQHGRDFVGLPEVAIFTLAANAVIWFFMPSLLLWAWAAFSRRGTRSYHV
jgi:hypothetical protein